MKKKFKSILTLFIFLYPVILSAQGQIQAKVLTLEDVFGLAARYSVELRLSANAVKIEAEQTQIRRLARLPELGTSFDYAYLSNADIWSPSFRDHRKGKIPHPFTRLSVTAEQLVFKGNQVNAIIEQATLEEKVVRLKQQSSQQEIRLLVAAKYLDILKLFNQRIVFSNNLFLARERLRNIKSLFKQGAVTENDVLRTELIISDFELALKKIAYNLDILNEQLNIVIGMQPGYRLEPDTNLVHPRIPLSLAELRGESDRNNLQLKISDVKTSQAAIDIRIVKSERLPQLALFAGSTLQRPFLNSLPAINVYYNVYQAGVGLRYNISSIYQSRPKIRAANLRLKQAELSQQLQRQQVDVEVSTAYTRYLEANEELRTNVRNVASALENFRIVEKKYFNQLALQTDLIDATNIKVEAELDVSNSRIDVEYSYYQLLYAIGKL
ncbi:MAG: TolC family protein [Chitinophagaceae bacterium]